MSDMALSPALLSALGAAGPGAAPTPADNTQGGQDTMSILRDMIDLAKQYLDVETDQEDIHTMTKVLQTLQQYLANEQKQHDNAMAGKASPKLLRQTYGG